MQTKIVVKGIRIHGVADDDGNCKYAAEIPALSIHVKDKPSQREAVIAAMGQAVDVAGILFLEVHWF